MKLMYFKGFCFFYKIRKLPPKIVKIYEKKKLFLKINYYKLFFCLEEATIGLIPSRDHILIILKIIYKEKWVFPTKNMLIWPVKGEHFPFFVKNWFYFI